tara:strand:- start:88 stop:777 length:690 start_codon:yes stop_codon:yes gene_type:complete
MKLAKRLSEKQKEEMSQSFSNGKTIDELSNEFNCSKLTIIRNLKRNLGESTYKELINKSKKLKKELVFEKDEETNHSNIGLNLESSNDDLKDTKTLIENQNDNDPNSFSQFIEISPLDYEIENSHQKELSSVPISEINFPKIVYMIVDKKIELEIKLLKDYPEWSFLPIDDLNRKAISVYFDLKIAKRLCYKEQKVIKVPNTDVFRIVAPILRSRGISRIVSSEELIAL